MSKALQSQARELRVSGLLVSTIFLASFTSVWQSFHVLRLRLVASATPNFTYFINIPLINERTELKQNLINNTHDNNTDTHLHNSKAEA